MKAAPAMVAGSKFRNLLGMNNLIRNGNLTPQTILGTPMPYVKLAVCAVECQFLLFPIAA